MYHHRSRHRSRLILGIIVIAIAIAIVYAVFTADISALPQPGAFETRIATGIRNWYIGRAAERASIDAPPNDASEVSAGEGLFGMACSTCHGENARNPTSIGKAMYPRAADLGSPEVQKLSDPELFWIVKNGIRLSGMPGFGNTLSDAELWQATYYVRSLGKPPAPK